MAQLHAGDRLESPKKEAKFIIHHAIYVGVVNGLQQVVENQINHGVRLVTLEQFRREHPDFTVTANNVSSDERQRIVNEALNKLGKPYTLLGYNCETFANDVQYGTPVSHQVKKWGMVAGSLLSSFLFIKWLNNKSN
jgi:Lecithin retinol acyltransferase